MGKAKGKKNATAPTEEMKAKFREALERKQSHDAVGSDADSGDGKVSGAHGPAKQQQMFRRKAGG